MEEAESSAPKWSTVIRFCLPKRRSTRLTSPAPVPTVDKADEMILQDTLQISLAEHKSQEEQEARENVELVNKHLASEEIEKMMEGSENVIDDSFTPRNDEPNIPGTRLEPKSDKESPEVEITNDEEVEITNVVIPMNVNKEEEEITDEVYELKRRDKGKIVEDSWSTPFPTLIRSHRIYTDLVSSDTEKLQELTGRYTYLFEHLKARFLSRKSFDTLVDHLQEVMVESLPTMVDTHIKEQVKKQVPEQVPQTTCRPSVVRPRDQDYPHDDAHPEGENHTKRQNTSEYEAYMSGESLSGQLNEEERGPSTSVITLTIDEAKLKKMANEMLRKRCTSGDEHQYHIDQMKNFLKSDIVWEKRKFWAREIDIVTSQVSCNYLKDVILKEELQLPDGKQKEPRKPKEVIYSNSKIIQVIKTYWELGHEHKFITEIVARRANECIVSITEPDYKNLNKNDIEDMYLLIMNGKVPDYAETGLLWSLSVFIRSSVIWERVHDFQLGIESYQQKVNLTAPTISFPGVEKHKMFSIIYEPVHGIIYKNSKKEKRVMRHSEIHKFCDATLIRVLEGLKSYNNDVKYGYVQRELTNDEVEYLKLFEEEIEVRLKYRNQMRRWEIPIIVLAKDLESAKNKKEKYKSLALKARQVLSDKDASSLNSNDEEYAMAVRDFKKFFRRRGKFVRQPYDDKKNFQKVKEDKKEDRMCFKCGDPNHFISDCPKNSLNDQKAFVVGCWSDSGDDKE
ncbi:retrovirus-related pol polyprotein from transposon TNT 1-94 [Tanacetum coccineum]